MAEPESTPAPDTQWLDPSASLQLALEEGPRKFTEQLDQLTRRLEDLAFEVRFLVQAQMMVEWLKANPAHLAPQHQVAEPIGTNSGLFTAEAKLRVVTNQVSLLINQIRSEISDNCRDQIADAAQGTPPSFTFEQRSILRLVLHRAGCAPLNVRIPEPSNVLTGIDKLSQIFLFDLTERETHRPERVCFAAKFDRLDRAADEWRQIDALGRLPLPTELVLPIPMNGHGDGVVLTRAAETPHAERCIPLMEYLHRGLASATPSCIRALSLAATPLRTLYQFDPGKMTDVDVQQVPLRWEIFFPFEEHRSVRQSVGQFPRLAILENHSRNAKIDVSGEVIKIGSRDELANPLRSLESRLSRYTHRIRLSRIHGDLNLTNLLVCPHSDWFPHRVFIIDWERSRPAQPTAIDFARLEVEFWDMVYRELMVKEPEDVLLDQYAKARDQLDGRTGPGPSHDLAINGMKLMLHWRRLAYQVLVPEDPSHYLMSDYFYCLYFLSLHRLKFRLVHDDPLRVKLSLLSAGLALQMLEDKESGRYSPGTSSGYTRPWQAAPEH